MWASTPMNMTLCSNRFPLPGSPSTCILDTAIVPIPSFLFIIGVIVFARRVELSRDTLKPLPRWLLFPYLFFVFAIFGMSIVELVRLGADHLGLGLLPVTPVAMVLVFFLLFRQRNGRTTAVSLLLLPYFLVLAIFLAIKTSRLVKLDKLYPGKGSKYPASDQMLDNAVMLGLLIVTFIVESIILFMKRRNAGHQRKLNA